MLLTSFLKNIRRTLLLTLKSEIEITIVLGNESCDLDSSVSALVLAHYLSEEIDDEIEIIVFPILNVTRSELHLKTEVLFCLRKVGIDPETDIICKDDSDLLLSSVRDVVLVDHHVPSEDFKSLTNKISAIIDHREVDINSIRLDLSKVKIEKVGSCATLIAERVILENPSYQYRDEAGLKLIYWTILTDTVNCSSKAKKVTPKDVLILEKIEEILNLDKSQREAEFQAILNAKSDVSSLTTEQILRRDLKVVNGSSNIRVAMSSVMMSLREEFIERPDFITGLEEFVSAGNYRSLVVMGVKMMMGGNGIIQRDLLIFRDPETDLTNYLENIRELNLIRVSTKFDEKIALFTLGDPSHSRKKVLPLIESYLMKK